MATGDREIKIQVTVDSRGAVEKIKTLDGVISTTEESTTKAGQGFSRLQAAIVTANQAVQLGTTVFNAFRSGANQLFDALDQAQKIEGLNASFERLQERIGVVAEDKLVGLQDATLGLIPKLDLLQSANQAVLLGVDKGTGEFEELAAAAVKLGQATGRTANEALGDLITGIGRASPLILDNLGITIKASEAYELFAAANDKAVDKLTETEKKLAFQAAAADKVREAVADLGDIQETAAVSSVRLQVTISDLTTEFLEAFSANTELGQSLGNLNDALKEVDVASLADDLATLISYLVDASAAVIKFAGDFKDALASLSGFTNALNIQNKAAKEVGRQYDAIADDFKALANASKPTKDSISELSEELETFDKLLNSNGQFRIPAAQKAYADMKKTLDRFKISVEEAEKPVSKLNDSAGKSKDEVDELAKSIERFNSKVADATGTQGVPELVDQFRELFDNEYVLNSQYIADTIKEIGENALTSGKYTEEQLVGTLKQAKDETDNFRKSVLELSDDLKNGFFGFDITGNEELDKTLADNITGALGDALRKLGSGEGFSKEDFAGLAQDFGGAIADTFVPGSGPIASAIIDNISQIGDSTRDSIFGAIDTVFPGIGSVTEGIFGGAIDRAFGGNTNAEANAREAVGKFFREAFDANNLQVIVDGELQRLDLGLSDRNLFDGGKGFEFFNTLPDQSRAAFEGVGQALTDLLGVTEDVGAQIGAVLAQGVGGDLFELKLAIEATGFSLEEMEEALVETALNGEQSFLAVQGQLQAIGQLAEEGVPGQIGAVGVAFDKMREAGVLGGRYTTEALKAVAAEALELGIETVPDLKQALIDAGASDRDVLQLEEAMNEVGLSVKDLAQATDRELIAVLADLESQGFAFAEKASDQVDKLIGKLDRIPRDIVSNVTVRVRTEGDVDALNQVSGGEALND